MSFESNFDSIVHDMKKIMLHKRALRGTENISRQGLPGVITRVAEDKLSRIQRQVADMDLRNKMAQRGIPQETIDEHVPLTVDHTDTLEDDLLDGANYFIIAILLLRQLWDDNSVDAPTMTKVYICHPFAGDEEGNSTKVLHICKELKQTGVIPIGPHIYLPQFIDESTERDLAMRMCIELIDVCDEIRVYGPTISPGMKQEIQYATDHGIPVTYIE